MLFKQSNFHSIPNNHVHVCLFYIVKYLAQKTKQLIKVLLDSKKLFRANVDETQFLQERPGSSRREPPGNLAYPSGTATFGALSPRNAPTPTK